MSLFLFSFDWFYAVAMYAPTSVPSMSYKLTAYLLPAFTVCVIVNVSGAPGATVSELPDNQSAKSIISPLTLMFLTVKLLVPELVTCTTILPVVALP